MNFLMRNVVKPLTRIMKNAMINILVPMGWTMITILMLAYSSSALFEFLQGWPIISAPLLALWFFVGLAYFPFSKNRYNVITVIISTIAFGWCMVGMDFANTSKFTWIILASSYFGLMIALISKFGTKMWRHGQGIAPTQETGGGSNHDSDMGDIADSDGNN